MTASTWCKCTLGLWLTIQAGLAWAEPVAVAISVSDGAFVERGSKRLRIVPRGQIENGDIIRTNATGSLQVLFKDRTRLAVGPNSRVEVTDIDIAENRRARKFSLSFLSGAFRFLSGNSPKQTYELSTPTATMGIRGTTFDITIEKSRQTSLALFDGSVEFCTRSTRCALLRRGCAMVQSVGGGRFEPPENLRERDSLIRRLFPFIVSQDNLRQSFRARTERCGDIEGVTYFLPTTPRIPVPASPAPPAPSPTGSGNSGEDRSGGTGGNNTGGGGNTGGGKDEGPS